VDDDEDVRSYSVTGWTRDGQPKKDTILMSLEIDAAALLRKRGGNPRDMRERLSARMYLLQHGWTLAEVNEAASAQGG
jgi:hypothetical protein